MTPMNPPVKWSAFIRDELAGASPDCLRFFVTLGSRTPVLCTVRQFGDHIGVPEKRLKSRFVRAGLPSPKRYLAMARLVRVARLFEFPALLVSDVAALMCYATKQGFARHMRLMMGCSPLEFRAQYTQHDMVNRFRAELIVPHRSKLLRFEPFAFGEPVYGGAARDLEQLVLEARA